LEGIRVVLRRELRSGMLVLHLLLGLRARRRGAVMDALASSERESGSAAARVGLGCRSSSLVPVVLLLVWWRRR
jgi:hypothetical protein